MREGTGTKTFDEAIFSNDGAITGADWVAGKRGYALDFVAASEDVVTVTHATSLSFASGNFTLEAWVKTSGTPTNANIVAKMDIGGEYGYEIMISGGKAMLYVASVADSVELSGTSSVNDNSWHHIVGVRDGNNYYIYVDGILENSETYTLGTTNNTDNLLIGNDISTTYYFDGTIDNVKVYSRALSAAEVMQHALR